MVADKRRAVSGSRAIMLPGADGKRAYLLHLDIRSTVICQTGRLNAIGLPGRFPLDHRMGTEDDMDC